MKNGSLDKLRRSNEDSKEPELAQTKEPSKFPKICEIEMTKKIVTTPEFVTPAQSQGDCEIDDDEEVFWSKDGEISIRNDKTRSVERVFQMHYKAACKTGTSRFQC